MLWLMTLLGLAMVSCAAAEVALETPRARIALGEDASWVSILDRAGDRECLATDAGLPIASVRHEDQWHVASSLAAEEDLLILGFADTDTRLCYRVEPGDDWLVFRLESIEGTRPRMVTLLQAPVAITERVGRRLNIAWDDDTAVCLMAATRQTDCYGRRTQYALLQATSQDVPGPPLEGSAVALIVCPTADLTPIARSASHAFGLLTNEDADGTPVKNTELVRGSYWFLGFGEDEVDRALEYCEQAGVRQIMLSSGAWCTSPGHYLFNEGRYPNGREGLKGVVDWMHEHGILMGMHCFLSKVSKRDPYVTPAPDPRLLRDMESALAEDISAEQTEIRVAGDLSRWPGSSQVADRYWEGGVIKHQEVTIGDEIIQYAAIGPEGVWDTFLECTRGAWGTTAAAHGAGDPAWHVAVDGCINGYIIDQETDLMDEVADRWAEIFNYCGFDMMYFDGGEDVDRRRYRYYVSNFQEQAVSRTTRRPVVHMGTAMTHLLWHSFARSSTVDQYLSTLMGAISGGKALTAWPTVRDHIDRSVRYMLSVQQDMMPGELGWFGIWPPGQRSYTVRLKEGEYEKYRDLGCEDGPRELPSPHGRMTGRLLSPEALQLTVEYDGLQLDEIEYLMVKSLAYDAPISLQTSFARMDAHVLTPEILRIVREYEGLRMARAVPEPERQPLRQMGRDFALVQWQGERSWAEVEPVTMPGDTREVRALVGAFGEGSVATIWHVSRDGHVLLDLPATAVNAVDFGGEELPVEEEDGKALIAVDGERTTLVCPDVDPAELRAALERAELRLRQPTMIVVRAGDAARIEAKMALGSQVEVAEEGAFGDVLVATAAHSPRNPQPWYAEYTVDLPHEGVWTFWARVRYPRGSDESFGLVFPHEEVTLSGKQVLGNCGVGGDRWHWTGSGAGSTAAPPRRPIMHRLPAGPLTFRVHARESRGEVATNPRLDLILISDEGVVPTDEDATRALEEQ